MYVCIILKVIAKKKNCEASNSPRKYGGKKKKGPGQLGCEEKQKESKKRKVKEGESTQRIARLDP